MYPTVHSNSSADGHAVYPSRQQAGPGSSSTFTANGPSQLTSAPSTSNVLPVLRVQIAEEVNISPPVMISSETGNVPRTEFNQAFDFERQVLRDFSTESQRASSVEVDEPGEPAEVYRYTQLNHEHEAVVMALLAVTATEDRDTQVLKLIEDYSNLKSMGFAPEVITGSMIAYPNDITEATEACIGAST
ncbi:TPA: hypothetical protein ACH3X2_009398 [Trebouxia sp. C0005]